MLWKLPSSQRHQRINSISHRGFTRSLSRNKWSGMIREPLLASLPGERAPHSIPNRWSPHQQAALPRRPCQFSGRLGTWLNWPVISTLCLRFALPTSAHPHFHTTMEKEHRFHVLPESPLLTGRWTSSFPQLLLTCFLSLSGFGPFFSRLKNEQVGAKCFTHMISVNPSDHPGRQVFSTSGRHHWFSRS